MIASLPVRSITPPGESSRHARRAVWAVAVLAALCPAAARADYFADIGYTALREAFGETLPDGAGVPVLMVESDHDADPAVVAYAPKATHREFRGKKITVGEGGPEVYAPFSGHATGVGRRFFGTRMSVAPGIDRIASYLTDTWYGPQFLRLGEQRQPKLTVGRVASHAWVGQIEWAQPGMNPLNTETLRRVDWLVETDEQIHVVGFTGRGETPLLADACNVIAVFETGSEHHRATLNIDRTYQPGRALPHLVVPEDSPSTSTGRAASVAALLVATGHGNPALSNGKTQNRRGRTIYNAERSEVIRAVLLAGAARRTDNTTGADIDAYRGTTGDRTVNGMDRRYGAGQMNVFNSYRILAGGEQDSREDGPAEAVAGAYGFDYDASFGSLGDSNAKATYRLRTGERGGRLTLALTWNLDVAGGTRFAFDPRARLADLDLVLYDVTGGLWVRLAESRSRRDNSENLQVELEPRREYEIRVVPGEGAPEFEWDYALAWRLDEPE